MAKQLIYNDEDILDFMFSGKMDTGFQLLVDKYQERLYWHIRRMVTFHEDADDVLQNTFVKVYKSIHKFKKEAKLFTWMYRIATNESITHLNKKKKQRLVSDGESLSHLEQKLVADSYFDASDIQVQLQLAINLLPKTQKAVFCMRYYDELSYKEISAILETSVGSLKASYHHAVKKIEHYLKRNIAYV